MAVIIQPASDPAARANFARTIEQTIPIQRVAPFLTPEKRGLVETAHTEGSIRVWGVTPSTGRSARVRLGRWNRVSVGDLVAFAQGQRFVMIATITFKIRSPQLANELWGQLTDGQTWEYVYFVANNRNIDVAAADVVQAIGFDAGYWIREFLPLTQAQSDAVLQSKSVSRSRRHYGQRNQRWKP